MKAGDELILGRCYFFMENYLFPFVFYGTTFTFSLAHTQYHTLLAIAAAAASASSLWAA
jgi:hypothetical protein